MVIGTMSKKAHPSAFNMNLAYLDEHHSQNCLAGGVVSRIETPYMRTVAIPLDTLENWKKAYYQFFMDKIQISILKPALLSFHTDITLRTEK